MRHRLPVGTIVPIDPHTVLGVSKIPQELIEAGLNPSRMVQDHLIRRRLGLQCPNMGCKVAPTRCCHVTEEVTETVALTGATILSQGQTWARIGPIPTHAVLRDETRRAHRAGLGAVAVRVIDHDGKDCSRPSYGPTYAKQGINQQVFNTQWERYEQLSVAELYALGFDRVVEMRPGDTFTLMPETWDARHVETTDAVVVGDIHGLAGTFFNEFLPAIGTDKDLSNPDVFLISVGDVHDKGPVEGSVELLRWWVWAIRSGRALMVDSNHSRNLVEYLAGKRKIISPAMADVVAALDQLPDGQELKNDILMTFSRLPSHLVFTNLAVAHAALTENRIGATALRDRKFMLYSVQSVQPWIWTGQQTLVHGHETVPSVTERQEPGAGRVINVDTGAVSGGLLTGYHHNTGHYTQVVPYPHEIAATQTTTARHISDFTYV